MRFAMCRHGASRLRDEVAEEIAREFARRGYVPAPTGEGVRFVLNLTDLEAPRAYRRRSKAVMVVSVVEARPGASSLRTDCYAALVRSLSNLLLCVVPPAAPGGPPQVYLTTPEAGFAHLPFAPGSVCDRLEPVVGAHFAIDNVLAPDLPPRLWGPSPAVQAIAEHGRTLDALGVLPTPFPLHEVLSPRDLRHVYKLFGMTGMSYGNLSARERTSGFPGTTFWMTGRGVDKSRISRVGKDVLLVKGLRGGREPAIVLSVPPAHDPEARVSVDAIEHYLVYDAFPRVNAIVHVHAWMEGVPSTRQNYPCGTLELALEVVALLASTPDPSRAVVGLRNHGLTITGNDLGEILDRVRGCLVTEVPMCA